MKKMNILPYNQNNCKILERKALYQNMSEEEKKSTEITQGTIVETTTQTDSSDIANNSADILLFLNGRNESLEFVDSIDEKDEFKILELLESKIKTPGKEVFLFLDTPGGDMYAGVKIMDILETKYEKITIAVAKEAKSTGTLMCLGADKIVMSAISALGPLDKPWIHPDNETYQLSALDIVKSMDDTIEQAFDKQVKFASSLRKDFRLSKMQALEISSNFTSQLYSNILVKEDTKKYHEASRLLLIAQKYGVELLKKGSLSYLQNQELKNRVADIIVDTLIWKYPDHGYSIRRAEAKNNLILNVEDAEENTNWNKVWPNFKSRITGGSYKKVIEFYEQSS